MPRSPETHAKIADVEAAEEALPWQEWIEEIMENLELHEYRCPSSCRVRDEIRAAEQAQSSSRVADVDAAVSQGTVLLGSRGCMRGAYEKRCMSLARHVR